MSIQQIIDNIKLEGLQAFGPKNLTTYVYFTDGTRIGYAQTSRVDGISFSTVHKPCLQSGTGFKVDTMQGALAHSPVWVNGVNCSTVKKFKDFAEFASKHWQSLVQY